MCTGIYLLMVLICISLLATDIKHLFMYLLAICTCFFFFFWPRCMACGIQVPQPEIEPVPPSVEAWSLNHWTTREVPVYLFWWNVYQIFCLFLNCLSSYCRIMAILYVIWIWVLYQVYYLQIFSPSLCLDFLHSLIVSLKPQTFEFWWGPIYHIFSFIHLAFDVVSKNSLPN